MLSTLRGLGSKGDDSTSRLREWDCDKEEGVLKYQIFADAICERSSRAPYQVRKTRRQVPGPPCMGSSEGFRQD